MTPDTSAANWPATQGAAMDSDNGDDNTYDWGQSA